MYTQFMVPLVIETSPEFDRRLDNYPEAARIRLMQVRQLVHQSARELSEVTRLEETLKWGEPSFVTKHGSTLRMDWKPRAPDQISIYFKCTSRLIPTFKMALGDIFTYEKDRAILIKFDQTLPETELKQCFAATLRYHKVKSLPNLGIEH